MSRRRLSQAEGDALGKEIDKEIDYHLRQFVDNGSIRPKEANEIMEKISDKMVRATRSGPSPTHKRLIYSP